MRRASPAPPSQWRQAFYVTVIYGGIALVFTLFGVLFGPKVAQIGGTRDVYTIPGHVLELAGFGLLLGLGCMVVYGRRGLPFVFLVPVLTVLLDIDHLPAYLGFAQTIRPAHSLVFLVAVLAATAITFKSLDLELVIGSAFMGHLAIDTGLFAPFSPLSFQYFQLDPYRPLFIAGAVLCTLAAGAVLRTGSENMNVRGGKVAAWSRE